jgi:hypothetical protein
MNKCFEVQRAIHAQLEQKAFSSRGSIA